MRNLNLGLAILIGLIMYYLSPKESPVLTVAIVMLSVGCFSVTALAIRDMYRLNKTLGTNKRLKKELAVKESKLSQMETALENLDDAIDSLVDDEQTRFLQNGVLEKINNKIWQIQTIGTPYEGC